jgi:hypothetical protein
MPRLAQFSRALLFSLGLWMSCACGAGASSATLLLEEPYGKLGWFTATGHAAVYLSGVCAETPLELRPCREGEWGAVISRYNGVGGHDWMAIPLIPYLYAVERPDDIPLFADPKMVNFLRDQYRRKYLEVLAPDLAGDETPGGNWYQLVGSAYDRTSYAFQVATSPQRDREFIRAYNASQNRPRFRTVSSNCADFAKDVINFYYPKALHRSVVADLGITTPKQMAMTLAHYGEKHSEAELTRYVIPQVPGSPGRSTAVHGVVESFFRSKKYMVPSVVVSPIFAGCVAAVYVETEETSRFHPAREALVFAPGRELEAPLQGEDRRSYEIELKHLGASSNDAVEAAYGKAFERMIAAATPGFDFNGSPVLRMQVGPELLNLGVAQSNILGNTSSGQLAQLLMRARLKEELRRGNPPKASASDVERDWTLLRKAMNMSDQEWASRSARVGQPAPQDAVRNRP